MFGVIAFDITMFGVIVFGFTMFGGIVFVITIFGVIAFVDLCKYLLLILFFILTFFMKFISLHELLKFSKAEEGQSPVLLEKIEYII